MFLDFFKGTASNDSPQLITANNCNIGVSSIHLPVYYWVFEIFTNYHVKDFLNSGSYWLTLNLSTWCLSCGFLFLIIINIWTNTHSSMEAGELLILHESPFRFRVLDYFLFTSFDLKLQSASSGGFITIRNNWYFLLPHLSLNHHPALLSKPTDKVLVRWNGDVREVFASNSPFFCVLFWKVSISTFVHVITPAPQRRRELG